MNIGFVHNHNIVPTSGGLERVTFLLAEEFSCRGHSVSFLSGGSPELQAQTIGYLQVNIPVMTLPSNDIKERFASYVNSNKIDLLIFQDLCNENLKMMKYVPGNVCSVVVMHNQPLSILFKERRVKLHTANSHLRPKGKLLKLLAITMQGVFRKLYVKDRGDTYHYIMKHTDQFILLSDRYLPRMMQNVKGLDPARLMAINNPITFLPERKNYSQDAKKNILLMVCRLTDPQKNVTGFIDIWNEFSRKNADWEAVIVGDGEDGGRIRKYAESKKVERLRFEGSSTDVENYYREAKIFCMTSHYEGWPMTLMEAMAFGCVPVVYDSFEAVHDIMKDGFDGRIVPAFQQHSMVDALSSLASDAEEIKRMAENAINTVLDFTVDKIVDEWEEKVFPLVEEKKRRI